MVDLQKLLYLQLNKPKQSQLHAEHSYQEQILQNNMTIFTVVDHKLQWNRLQPKGTLVLLMDAH